MKTTPEAQSLDEALDAFLAEQPKERECETHPGQTCKLSRELTRLCAGVNGDGSFSFTGHFSPCPLCERERLLSQGVPPALVHCAFDNWRPRNDSERQHLELVREFARVRRGFLFLLGPVGTGKSHLAVSIMRAFSSALFVRQAQLLRQLRQHYHNDAVANPIAGAQGAGLLVLDELGVSSGGRDEQPMLDEILAARYERRLPTVVTSNLAWNAIAAALGERLEDRLRESTFRVLVFEGGSHRANRRAACFAGTERGA
jgi:DNA replication protein DnaC